MDINFDTLKKAIDGLEKLRISPSKNFFCSQVGFDQLYDFLTDPKKPILRYERSLFGISVRVENSVPDNTFFHCTSREMEIYRRLKQHPWIDKDVDLLKLTARIYEQERITVKASSDYFVKFRY